jgi:PadR family transcriptional regulator PadR
MRVMKEKKIDLLQGTLDLLVLKALSLGPLHGIGVSQRIEQITRGTFQVKPGSLFPALHRMEEAGWFQSSWGESQNNRRAKFYRLTKAGERQLEAETEGWQRNVPSNFISTPKGATASECRNRTCRRISGSNGSATGCRCRIS